MIVYLHLFALACDKVHTKGYRRIPYFRATEASLLVAGIIYVLLWCESKKKEKKKKRI